MKSQATTPTGSPPTLTISNALFPPTADNLITGTFGTGSAAKITSQNGTSIVLSGDGSGKVGPWSWDSSGNMLTMPDRDTGWVDFTCGSGTGMFAGTTGITLCRYRILNGYCTVQIARTVLVAEVNTSNANWSNDQVTANNALPSVARPTLTGLTNMYGYGNIVDVPATVAISSIGTVFTVGGGLRSFAVGELFQCSITYPLG
jgi:hypothetical protein